MKKMVVTLAGVLAALALETALLETEAAACGGTFCDSGPMSMAVEQSGENILFVMDGATVEAHIQIQYKGDAKRFAWVLPVPTVPTIAVGSKPLLDGLLAATVPQFGYSIQNDCPVPSSSGCASTGCTAGCSAGCNNSCGCTGSCCSVGGGPTVVSHSAIGAYDVIVLAGGTAAEVSDWLSTNGYASTPTTPALLAPYTAKSYVFVAVKLVGEAGTDEIHPLVVKYPGSMPCIPLILTAEAALDDMGVRAFFLAHDRVYPENYADVLLNPVQIDWLSLGSNYERVVSRAVDEAPDHHGFVTEYAGDSSVVSQSAVYDPKWDATAFQDIAPEDVPLAIADQDLGYCSGPAGHPVCSWRHPLVLPLLHQYLPPAAGYGDGEWYSDLPGHVDEIDLGAWDAAGFAADFDARIVQPGVAAQQALATNPYLTRMFTVLSPAEMTVDPTFNVRADLDQTVSNRHTGTLHTFCDGRQRMELPGGRFVWIDDNGNWPTFVDDMPFAALIQSVPAAGDPVVIVDNNAHIDGDLAGTLGEGCGCRLSSDDDAWYGFIAIASLAAVATRRRRR